PFHIFAQVARVFGYRRCARSRIFGIVTSDGLEHMGKIFNGACHRSTMIQRPTEWREAVTAHSAIGGFESDDAAESRRIAKKAEVWRWQRPVSAPREPKHSRPATDAPEPVLEPPVMCSVFHGLRGSGK